SSDPFFSLFRLSLSRLSLLRVLCALRLCALCVNSCLVLPLFRALCALRLRVLCVTSCLFFSVVAPAQQLDKPALTIDEELTSFSIAPDGRIAYGVRRNVHNKKYDLQHDDIWIQDANGKRRRI